jgi:hypothetical protein
LTERVAARDRSGVYAEGLRVGVPGDADRAVREAWVRVWVQAVPAHIDHAGPGWDEWLPPPTPAEVGGADREEQRTPRAVFFVTDWTPKGTERNGQEYVRPLLVLTGEEYVRTMWPDLMERLTDAVEDVLRDASAPGESRPAAGGDV